MTHRQRKHEIRRRWEVRAVLDRRIESRTDDMAGFDDAELEAVIPPTVYPRGYA